MLSVLFLCVLPLGHDLWYHLYRIGAMAVELQEAPLTLPIRMLSDTYNGYGYGAALYYGDIFLYIPALLVRMGMDVVLAYKIFTVLILWGTMLAAYGSMRLMKKDKNISLIFACFYTFSSCSLLNLCIRSAVGEALAYIFLPLVAAAFWNILYAEKDRKNWLFLGLGMAAIALSHMLTLFLMTLVLCVWSLVEIKKIFKEMKVLEIIKAAVFMIGLSASFLFPMFEQMMFQKVQTPGNNDYQKQAFMDYSVEWMDYFIPYEVKKIMASLFSLSWDIETWHPGTIGLFAILLIIMLLWIKPGFNAKQKSVCCVSVTALVLLGILPVMDIAKHLFAFMQFPWRVLPLITLGLTFSAIALIEKCREKQMVHWLMIVGTLLIAVWAIGPRYAYQMYVQRDNFAYIQENNPSFYEKYLLGYDRNSADCLYLPEGVNGNLYLDRGEVIRSNYEDMGYGWERKNGQIVVEINRNDHSDSELELPLYMYKGYTARTWDGDMLTLTKSEQGLVNVIIDDYLGKITIWYSGTLCQKIADLITAVTILGAMVWYLGTRNRKLRKP